MKKLYFNSFPRFVERERYQVATDDMVRRLNELDGIRSVYQLGSITTPGISDIDLLAVFEDGFATDFDPLSGLDDTGRYLFTHTLYGISEKDFAQACRFTFFHNYQLLSGCPHEVGAPQLADEEVSDLKTQIALEFLIKMYVSLVVELTYRIVKVRSLLLHIKALRYDMEFLDITSGALYDLIQELTDWRSRWFDEEPDLVKLQEWIHSFYRELKDFLTEVLHQKGFFVPADSSLRIGRNIQIRDGKVVDFIHKGFTLPGALAAFGRRYFNLQHRFNRFVIQVPYQHANGEFVVKRQIELYKMLRKKNRQNLPNFLPLTPSLNLF